jgi:hypothetical protein
MVFDAHNRANCLPLGLGQRGDQLGQGAEVDAAPGLDGFDAEGDGEVGLAAAGRSSVILPGVRRSRFGSSIRFTRAAAKSSPSLA